MAKNVDQNVVQGFGDEWSRFDQTTLSNDALVTIFENYFKIFPWDSLPKNAVGFDAGCGSGRWAKFVAQRVGKLNAIDASSAALDVARKKLSDEKNVAFECCSIDEMPMPNGSQDFGYSIGVLHCVPDPAGAVKSCAEKLKPGAPFLVYFHYSFDNKPAWFRLIWRATDGVRYLVSRLPMGPRYFASQVLAAVLYWPIARFASLVESLGVKVDNIPLSEYRNRPFYVMRNDALDRFGTRIENRYSRSEIDLMMQQAGLSNIRFLEGAPFWVAVGTRSK